LADLCQAVSGGSRTGPGLFHGRHSAVEHRSVSVDPRGSTQTGPGREKEPSELSVHNAPHILDLRFV
jgi:hypothetical protein